MGTAVTVLADAGMDLDRLMLEGVDTSEGSLFSVSEMAAFFFARSSHWVRWLESCHFTTPSRDENTGRVKQIPCTLPPAQHDKDLAEAHQHTWRFVLDGELLMPLRTKSNARKYDLALIEKIAHALASNGSIKADQLRCALMLVRIQAQLHHFL